MNNDKLNILVIDDDEVDCMSLKRSIRSSGFEANIVIVHNQKQGEEALKNNLFDCVFLDYHLPDCNGISFLKSHKKELRGAPVIMVTSQGDEMLAVEAMREGACDYIPKNLVNPDGISQSLRYALRIRSIEQSKRETEFALQRSELQLNAVIENSPIILFAVNEDGRFTMFRGKSVEMLNLNPDEIIGKTVSETNRIIPIDFSKIRDASAKGNISTIVEISGRHFEITCMLQKTESGQPGGLMGIATDITSLKKQEIELKNDLSSAKEMQSAKEQFLANMSHEIRTPIHGIMSLTNLLLKSNINNDQLTYLNAVKKSADNLLVIINDILDLSKIEAQKMTFESTIFSTKEVVDTTFELFRAKAGEKGIVLKKGIDECLPLYVKGDPTRLSQIINNLVNNAIKFTHKGSVELSANLVESNERCSMISFSIKDTGIGIPHDKMSTIFDMFTQAGDDITRKFGGTGLGLSIAKKLVDLQGGIIKVESELSKGTTFTFSLPFDHPEPEELEAHHSVSEEPESRIPSDMKILVVEDNDINRLVINKMMKDWGLAIYNAVNGADAIKKMKENDYDIILLDIEMPEMNGYQTIREIRTNLPEPKNNVAVMAMTAHANKKERDKCIQMGMDDYISKPFDPFDLKQKLAALSQRKIHGTCEVEFTDQASDDASASAVTTKVNRLTNLDYLRELSEDNESFFTDFLQLFLTTTPETLEDLQKHTASKNWEGVRQASHKIKPSLNYLGMKDANKLAAAIEENAKELQNIEKIPLMVAELCTTCEQAFAEINEELKSATAN